MKNKRKLLPLVDANSIIQVTAMDENCKVNIITLTLVGVLCWDPPILRIGVGRNHFSNGLIKKFGESVINIPTTKMIKDDVYCGTVSGKYVEKMLSISCTLTSALKI